LLKKNAKNLSSGEKMKVSIIRAIIFKPDTVLLDEPTSYLDVDSIHQLKRIINDLKSSINFIIVSHNEAFYNELVDGSLTLGGQYVYRQNN
ncbi:MAG: ATP-binding cassette domain-containing protein, partial [Candidatus Izemoplasma sp.]